MARNREVKGDVVVATDTEELTEDEVKSARKESRNARAAKKKVLNDYFTEERLEDIPEEVAIVLRPMVRVARRVGRAAVSSTAIKAKIVEMGRVSDLDLFVEFKVATREMAGHMRNWIKKAAPSERVWITFDSATDEYVHVGTGESPPEDWDGYVPVTSDLD